MIIVFIKEDYLIVESRGAAYVGELSHGLKPPISIHVARWCVMEFPVQWGVVMEILVVLIGFANNDGRHKAFTISSCGYKYGAP